jgi:DNA modification methylase
MSVRIIEGDCLATLRTLPDGAAQCCVTSPPYYGLRDYGMEGQIGLEDSPDDYVAQLVAVFREVRRVLRDDGTLWLNLGDSYAGNSASGFRPGNKGASNRNGVGSVVGCKPKDLFGIPWMVAFALRADGWYLRKDIIWHKPNPMPESVRDRPTTAHEHVFLLSKRAAYFYDAEAIAEASEYPGDDRHNRADRRKATEPMCMDGGSRARTGNVTGLTRNARDVWTIATQPYSGAHFATMPPDLAERCIKAGSKPGDTILDPFGGAGTTGLVADRLGRNALLIELNPTYAAMARERIARDAPLIASVA